MSSRAEVTDSRNKIIINVFKKKQAVLESSKENKNYKINNRDEEQKKTSYPGHRVKNVFEVGAH